MQDCKNDLQFSYQLHVGWLGWTHPTAPGKSDFGKIYAHPIQAIIIQQDRKLPILAYSTHSEKGGWGELCRSGQMSGSTGQSIPLDGIRLMFDDASFSISYRAYADEWSEWRKDGEELLLPGGLRGIEIAVGTRNDKQFSGFSQVTLLSPPQHFGIGELDKIGRSTGTDKSSLAHNYLNFYEEFFCQFRQKSFILVEIGIFRGQSIEMWETYFPNARIVAFDIVPKENRYSNTEIIIGDASDPGLLSDVLCTRRPLVIIEDGSHKYSHQIATFEVGFLYLQPGGFYVCEDIQTSFGSYRESAYNDQDLDAITYFNQLAALVANRGKASHPYLIATSFHQRSLAKHIEYIVFRNDCVLIKKKM